MAPSAMPLPPMNPPGGLAQPGYGQPGYGQAPYGYAPAVSPFQSRAKTVMWLGIVSLALTFICGIGMLLGPVAWAMSRGVKRDALAAGWPEPSENRTGMVLGIISTVILGLIVLAVIAGVIIAAAARTS